MLKYIYYQNISYCALWVTTVATCVILIQSGQEQVTSKINLHKLNVLRAVLLKIHILGCDNVCLIPDFVEGCRAYIFKVRQPQSSSLLGPFDPEDEGTMALPNVSNHSHNNTAPHHTGTESLN